MSAWCAMVSIAGVCLTPAAAANNEQVATQQCVEVARAVNPTFDAYYDLDTWHEFGTPQAIFRFQHCLASWGFHLEPAGRP